MPFIKYNGEWHELHEDQSPPTKEELANIPLHLHGRAHGLRRTKTGRFGAGLVFDAPIDRDPIASSD